MKKISIREVFFEMSLVMPLLYTLTYITGANNANKVIILYTIIAILFLEKRLLNKKYKTLFVVYNITVIFYLFYTSIKVYPGYILHSYFYTYLLLFTMMLIYIDEKNRHAFYTYFISARNRYLTYFIFFSIIILISVFFFNGIRSTGGLQTLFGPFAIGHYLAYILLSYYCGITNCFEKNSRLVIIIKIILSLSILFTAVRSASLALVIIILYEYLSARGFGKKFIVMALGILLLSYLFFNTNVILNSSVIQKTIIAVNEHGSITNNREWFRRLALDYYVNGTTVIEKILGAGFPNLLNAERIGIGAEIHSHNDYINTLVAYGLLGLIINIILQLKLIPLKNKWSYVTLQLTIFVLSFYNGFALYSMYTATLPIVLMFFERNAIQYNYESSQRRLKYRSARDTVGNH